MKVKLGQIYAAVTPLSKVIGKELPVRTAFKMARNIRQIEGVVGDIEKQKAALFEKYGTKEDDKITIKPENVEAFKTEFDTLMGTEIDLNVETFTMADLGSIELSVIEAAAIEWLIEVDQKPIAAEAITTK